jgi:hypothetical protein
MIDGKYTKTADGLEYNSKGYLMSPKPDRSKWNWLSVILTFTLPFAVVWDKWSAPFPSILLKQTGLFQVLVSRHLVSDNVVANIEFLLELLLLSELAGIPSFFKEFTERYSDQTPPPDPLRRLWPRQIRIMLAGGAIIFAVPIFLGSCIYWGVIDDFLSPKLAFLVPICLSTGLMIASEGLISGALYVFFYFRYWRSSDRL